MVICNSPIYLLLFNTHKLGKITFCRCLTRPGGRMLLGVPMRPADVIQFNAHRVYGPLQMSHMLANWEQIAMARGLETSGGPGIVVEKSLWP